MKRYLGSVTSLTCLGHGGDGEHPHGAGADIGGETSVADDREGDDAGGWVIERTRHTRSDQKCSVKPLKRWDMVGADARS